MRVEVSVKYRISNVAWYNFELLGSRLRRPLPCYFWQSRPPSPLLAGSNHLPRREVFDVLCILVLEDMTGKRVVTAALAVGPRVGI